MIKLKYGDAHDFKGCEDAVKLKDEEVQHLVDKVLEELQKDKDRYGNTYSGTGDTMVFGFKYEDEIDIYVCRNYEEGQIFKEEDGTWSKLDWLYDYEEDAKDVLSLLNDLSKEQLINIITKVLNNGKNDN